MRYAHLEPNVLNKTMSILDELQNYGQPVGNATEKEGENISFKVPEKTRILAKQ
jgi:hypothetical protein